MKNLRDVVTVKKGAKYSIPKYNVVKGEGLVLTDNVQSIEFVKGSIDGDQYAQEGTTTENVLSMLIEHLGHLNQGKLRNRHTSVAITKLEEARMWIEERKRDREARGVISTYKK
jgi:hypothetical protein